jgi:two-component system alkaline phosphatase synthesis response regulator PhoP
VQHSDSEQQTMRLLVVEDDVRLAQGLCRNLEMEQFRVASVHTGEAALAEFSGPDPGYDLMILDIMLPGIDGLEVCRRLRAGGNTIPILFLTARGSDADRILGLQLGADDYLPKPFIVEELILRVRGILRRAAWARSPAHNGPLVRIGQSQVDLATMQATTSTGKDANARHLRTPSSETFRGRPPASPALPHGARCRLPVHRRTRRVSTVD